VVSIIHHIKEKSCFNQGQFLRAIALGDVLG
jgi:hypothetical protein